MPRNNLMLTSSFTGWSNYMMDFGKMLQDQKVDVTVLTSPASIAWLFNIRGGDVTHSPLPLSFAVLRADGKARLFFDPAKISDGLIAHLGDRRKLLILDTCEHLVEAIALARLVLPPDVHVQAPPNLADPAHLATED